MSAPIMTVFQEVSSAHVPFSSCRHLEVLSDRELRGEGIRFASIITGIPLCLEMRNGLLKGKVSCMGPGLIRKKIQEVAGIAMAELKICLTLLD